MQSRNLIIISGLVIGVIVMANKGVQAKKDAALVATQIVVQDPNPEQQNLAAVSPEDMVMARKLVAYAAKANNVPVCVKLSGPDITITSAPEVEKTEQRGDGVAEASISAPAPDKDAVKENKEQTLSNYKGIRDFLYTLSGLPYAITCKSFCIGETCGNAAIEISLTVVGRNQPQQQAPAVQQQGQPPASAPAGGGPVQDPSAPKKG